MEEVVIVKPRTDKREYRRIVLANSLKALLISDSDTDKCAASMAVSVGSYCDPVGLEGLAHFLEHMLFYASEKYPEEDGYSTYITENGGSRNACTASENTNYFFDVNVDSFEEALDRFAQFFIKPLMSADATTREIKAVDSENQGNLLSDAWRMDQLQKHLSDEGHPYHKFGTGNLDTLEVRPNAKGIDTRQELIKFYEDTYSANLMHLVIYAKESLDKLQKLVEDKFHEIRNTGRSGFSFPGQPCSSKHLQILVRTVPVKLGHKLRIIWPITSSIHHYQEGPCQYLGHLIGHQGEGSLFYVLKTLGWATGLSAGEDDWSLEFSFFKVTIDVTDAGQEHMEDIIGLLFKYIQLLQQSGVCKWIFDELAAVCEANFHYQDKTPAIDYVVEVASNMQFYPPQDWLIGSSLPSKFNPTTIKTILDQLSTNNVRIFWESKNFEGKTDEIEPWYGTAYNVEKISDSMIQQWMLSAPKENLHLPARNDFIPTDFSLKEAPDEIEFPTLLRKTEYLSLWHKPDTLFSTPKAFVNIEFCCPRAIISPETEVLTDMFTRLVMDHLNEYAYYAQVAGLYYGIDKTDIGFQVTVEGYTQKLRILLKTVIEKIAKFNVNPKRFSVIKELMTKEYENFKFQQPYEQAKYYCSLILRHNDWLLWMEALKVLRRLEVKDISKFIPKVLSRAFLECYVHGNIDSSEAEEIVEHIECVFCEGNTIRQPLLPHELLTDRIIELDNGRRYIYPIEGLNPNDKNSALVHYIQVGRDDFLLNVKLQLFALIAKQPAFHQLRSVEQLGYITQLTPRNDSGVHGIQFIIQSAVKGSGSIDSRVEAFLEKFEKQLDKKFEKQRDEKFEKQPYEMTNEKFKNNVNALINMKLEKHKNLREESGFYWREISDGTVKFDRRDREVAALRQLTQEDLMDFVDEYIRVGAPRKRSLSIRVYVTQHSAEYRSEKSEPVPPDTVQIADIFIQIQKILTALQFIQRSYRADEVIRTSYARNLKQKAS